MLQKIPLQGTVHVLYPVLKICTCVEKYQFRTGTGSYLLKRTFA
jgi:hypothetical protein